MKRLRHPIRSIREPFGKAGLIVACIALVFAMVGGAYAAGKLTSKQKKEVEKIAKKFAGKPGANGAAGTAGTNGTNGKDGAPGPEGKQGPEGPEGPEGKPGKDGKDGTTGFTATLPKNATETGGWQVKGSGQQTAISFPIPLAAPLDGEHVHAILPNGKELTVDAEFNPTEVTPTACGSAISPAGSAETPRAAPGHLCVYVGATEGVKPGMSFGEGGLLPIQQLTLSPEEVLGEFFATESGGGADKSGARLMFAGEGEASGTFAVTAP